MENPLRTTAVAQPARTPTTPSLTMKPNPVVILHGWSDNSTSFKPLAAWLRTQGFPVTPIFLGDYLSMNDEITLKDLGYAFIRALKDKQVPQTPHAFERPDEGVAQV